ncbi:MAG: hypothetical protein F6J95_000240 [Leptolyngbya sp. SIO1E4]|nr:hypothetical protein [Leptolyngbya sp. SIO1E4]
MQKFLFIQLAVATSLLGAIAPASWAESMPTANPPATNLPATNSPAPATAPTLTTETPVTPEAPITLNGGTGLVVQFPIALTLTIDEGQPYPISLPLTQAILDDQGNVIIPAQTPVGMLLQPQEGGVQLVAESLVVNGQLIPIVGMGPTIPGTTVTYEEANAAATQSGAVFSDLFANAAGLMGNGNPNLYSQGAMLGSIVGTLAGLQSPETARVVQIPQGASYVLSLTTEVTF